MMESTAAPFRWSLGARTHHHHVPFSSFLSSLLALRDTHHIIRAIESGRVEQSEQRRWQHTASPDPYALNTNGCTQIRLNKSVMEKPGTPLLDRLFFCF
jgi:hypothetical protein